MQRPQFIPQGAIRSACNACGKTLSPGFTLSISSSKLPLGGPNYAFDRKCGRTTFLA